MLRRAAIGAVIAAALAGPAPAQELRVGIAELPPFSMRTEDGAWLGLAVDLWRIMAEDLGLSYQYIPVEAADIAAALRAGDLDVVLPVQATAALEEQAELSQPIYTATLGVASPRSWRIMSVVRGFLSWQFLKVVLGLSVLLLVVGAIVWMVERRQNKEQFHPSPLKGLGDGFWWAGVTLTTIGYGDKAPLTAAGRAVAMLWMLVGLAVSAALTATVVALANPERELTLPQDLAGERVAVVDESTTELFLTSENVPLLTLPDLSAALAALNAGEVDRVAAAGPVLEHAVSENASLEADISRTRLDPHYISIAFPSGSPLLEQVDVALLQRLSSETGWDLIRRYLPD